jgi:hypothetical protein
MQSSADSTFCSTSPTCNLIQWCRTLLLCGHTLGNTDYALMGYSLEQALVEPITTYREGIVHISYINFQRI